MQIGPSWRTFGAVAVVMLVALRAWGVDYYVSSAGKDTNNGKSVAAPFKTVTKALSVVNPGDTIYVRAGSYSAAHVASRSGEPGEPIRLVGDTSGAIFDVAGDVTLQWSQLDALVVTADYFELHNIRITSTRIGVTWTDVTGGRMVGCTLQSCYGMNMQVNASSVDLQDTLINDAKGPGITIGPGSSVRLFDSRVLVSSHDGIVVQAGGSVELWNCVVSNNRQDALDVQGGSALVVGSVFGNNSHSGITVSGGGSSVTVWNSTFAYNKNDGINAGAGTVKVRNSIMAFNSNYGIRAGGTVDADYNLVFGNLSGVVMGMTLGPNDIAANPLFRSTTDFRLLPGSPAINHGTTPDIPITEDLLGAERPGRGGFDMGAYEPDGTEVFADVSAETGFGVAAASGALDGGGMSWLDIDNDGDLDCLISGSTARLLINEGGVFVAASLGAMKRQNAPGDYDNDGDLDIVSAAMPDTSEEAFLVNEGGVLLAVEDTGITDPTGNLGAAAADVNNDGRLDAVILSAGGMWKAMRSAGTGTPFTTSTVVSFSATAHGFMAADDVNGDRILDIYAPGQGTLYLSGGKIALASETKLAGGGSVNEPVGAAWGDYDNDGDADLFVGGLASTTGKLHVAQDGAFLDASKSVGLVNPFNATLRGCAWGDYDNDGDLDLFVCTASGGNLFYVNEGELLMPVMIGAEVENALDVSFVDYDWDGDLDIAVTVAGGASRLFRNDTDNGKGFHVRVVGAGPRRTNMAGVGVVVELYDATGSTYLGRRTIGAARGLGGTEPFWAHFGGIDPDATYVVRARFADGVVEAEVTPGTVTSEIGGRTVSRLLTVVEPPATGGGRVVRWREVSVGEW